MHPHHPLRSLPLNPCGFAHACAKCRPAARPQAIHPQAVSGRLTDPCYVRPTNRPTPNPPRASAPIFEIGLPCRRRDTASLSCIFYPANVQYGVAAVETPLAWELEDRDSDRQPSGRIASKSPLHGLRAGFVSFSNVAPHIAGDLNPPQEYAGSAIISINTLRCFRMESTNDVAASRTGLGNRNSPRMRCRPR